MKTKTLISIFFLFLSLKIFCQTFSYGIKGGLDVTNFRYVSEISQDYNPKLSFDFGLVLNYRVLDKIELQIEPGFINKGSRTKFMDLTSQRIFKYNYVNLPLIVIINPFRKVNIEIGPEFGYLITSTIVDTEGNTYEIDSFLDKHFELAGNVGLSYNLFPKVNVYLRYSQAVTPVQDYYLLSMVGPSIPYKYYNKYATIGFRFMINRRNNLATNEKN